MEIQAHPLASTIQVARGAFINLVGNLGKVSHFAFDVVASRVLGEHVFGYFSTTWLVMHLCLIVCYFGAHRLVIDFVARHRDGDQSLYYRGILGCILLSFFLSILLVVTVYLLADDLAAFIGKPPVAEYLKIVCWSAPFYCLTTVLLSATRGIKIMHLWVFVRFGVEPFSDLVLLIVIYLLFATSAAQFYAKAVTFTLGAFLSVYIFHRYFSLRDLLRQWPALEQWKRILVLGFPIMVADFLSILILRVDIIPLSVLAAPVQVATFQVVLNISNVMRTIPQAIDPILMPVVVEMQRRNDYTALEHIYSTLIRATLFLAVGFYVMVLLFGPLLMSIYGDAYVPGFTALAIACCGVLLHTLSSSVEPALIMSGYPYLNLINNVFFVVVNLVADFLLIPAYGLIGAAIGSLTASLLTATLQTVMLYRVLHVQPLAWHYVWVLLYGLVFLILFKLLHSVLGEAGLYDGLAVRILLFGTYVVSYLVLGWKWVLHDEERKVFRSIIQRKPS